MTYNEIIECLYDLKDAEKVIFKEKKFGIISNNSLGIYHKELKMIAKEEAAVIWGHQVRWIDKNDFLIMKVELYDEDGYLVRTELGTEIARHKAPCLVSACPRRG